MFDPFCKHQFSEEAPRELVRITGSGCPNAGRIASSSAASPSVKKLEVETLWPRRIPPQPRCGQLLTGSLALVCQWFSTWFLLVMGLNRLLFFCLNAHFSSNSKAETCTFCRFCLCNPSLTLPLSPTKPKALSLQTDVNSALSTTLLPCGWQDRWWKPPWMLEFGGWTKHALCALKIAADIPCILDNGFDLCHRFGQGSGFWLPTADIPGNRGSNNACLLCLVWSPSPPTVGWLLFRHLMLPDLTPLVNNPRIISGHYLMFTLWLIS